jgi:hypothetical protein
MTWLVATAVLLAVLPFIVWPLLREREEQSEGD